MNNFIGYCFITKEKNSKYEEPAYLEGEENSWKYIVKNMVKFPRVMITYSDEIVLEAINGEVVFPVFEKDILKSFINKLPL